MSRWRVAVTGVVLSAALSAASQDSAKRGRSLFREGGPEFQNSVALAPAVVEALRRRPEAAWLREATETEHEQPAKFFRAARVHLCGSEESDLIVQGVFPLTGADQGWFWVVRSDNDHPSVVLFAPGNSLEVLGVPVQGCRAIRSSWESPNERHLQLFRFNGRQYVRLSERWIMCARSDDGEDLQLVVGRG